MVGENWELSPLRADIRLFPLSGATSLSSVVPWSPESRGCNLACSENKLQFSAGTVMGPSLAWDGDQSCLFQPALMLTPGEETCASPAVEFGMGSAVAGRLQHSVFST